MQCGTLDWILGQGKDYSGNTLGSEFQRSMDSDAPAFILILTNVRMGTRDIRGSWVKSMGGGGRDSLYSVGILSINLKLFQTKVGVKKKYSQAR